MEFENLKQSFVAREEDSLKYMEELSSLISSNFNGKKMREVHQEVENTIRKYVNWKYEKEIKFVYHPPKYGIGNNWERGIHIIDESKEIHIGNLHITNNMFGKEIVFFSTTDLNTKIDCCRIFER